MRYSDAKLLKILDKTRGKCFYCGVLTTGDRSFPGDDRPGAWNVDHLIPGGGRRERIRQPRARLRQV
jgi:hypothetical protein